MGRLVGEVCLVTGSTSGLGVEIARLFAAEGGAVIVVGRNQKRGVAVVEQINEAGRKSAFVAADLRVEADRVSLVDAARSRFGPVSVLVNNAVSPSAIVADGAVAEASLATWEEMLAVNLVAVASLCRLVVPEMQAARRGAIVNISSRAAERGTPGLAAYTASKGGLNALTRSITADYAGDGIRCNTVQPGYILNDERDRDASREQVERMEGMQLTRPTTAIDIAYAALFLACWESEVITGITLPVDGGSTATRGSTLG